jgi:hypothetical protein
MQFLTRHLESPHDSPIPFFLEPETRFNLFGVAYLTQTRYLHYIMFKKG